MAKEDCMAGLEPAEKTVEAGGLNWRYLEWNGDGSPTILLAHGVTSDARAWWRVGPSLAERGARVLALDMPGHGLTSSNADGTEWLTTARQLAAFVAATGLDRRGYRLAGHSWGGVTSLMLAAEFGLGLERLALLDPAIYLDPGRAEARAKDFEAEIGQPRKSRQEAHEWAIANNAGWHECDYYWKAGAIQHYQPEIVRDFYSQNAAQNVTHLLSRLEIPVLLLVSDEQVGGVLPLGIQAQAEAALRPGLGHLVKLPGVGHNLQREDYPGTMQHLKPFLLEAGS